MIFLLPVLSTALLIFAGFMMFRSWKKKVEFTDDEVAQARGRIRWLHQWGWGMIIIAFANIVKLNIPFPFPFVGEVSLYFSGLVALAGGIFLALYSMPKVNETLLVAARTNGILTETVLITWLGLSESLVEATLRKMMRLNLILPINPQETLISKIIFVARGVVPQRPQAATRTGAASGEREDGSAHAENSPEANPGTPLDDSQIVQQYQGIAERGVDAVNQMLLMGSLTLGQSGHPVGGTRRSRRRSTED